jgi:nucleotide exchange factor SIL1
VQIFAIKSQLLQVLLNKLTNFAQSTAIENQDFLSKLIFTLSGLLRYFPYAQSEFLKLGGTEILSNLMRSSNSLKIKTKILTLTDDLIKEKVHLNNLQSLKL